MSRNVLGISIGNIFTNENTQDNTSTFLKVLRKLVLYISRRIRRITSKRFRKQVRLLRTFLKYLMENYNDENIIIVYCQCHLIKFYYESSDENITFEIIQGINTILQLFDQTSIMFFAELEFYDLDTLAFPEYKIISNYQRIFHHEPYGQDYTRTVEDIINNL